ncbi:MAG TPA: flagellar basal body P-ring formation chaperone FlgA [Rhodocyclaceae bacterium]|nr:flagellar basal body P-ring formation chaperone FlgA [Rhodocyclaceae bacterium]
MRSIAMLRLLLYCLIATGSRESIAQEYANSIEKAVEQFLTAQTQNVSGKVSISVGKIGSSARAAQCKQWQAFLPTGARAWGRVTVGVRCQEGANLSLFVAASVKIEGRYVAMARPVSGGQILTAADLTLIDGELTAHPLDLVTQMDQAIGQTARQALSPNQPLRAVQLKAETTVQAGETVKVISRGASFAVANEGRALNSAERGQLVRVRLDNNQIVSGIARETGTVEVVTQ